MTGLGFAHHELHFRTFSPVLALLLLCLCGGPVLAEPLELGTAQLIERGRWGDIGCFGRTLDIEHGVAVVGDSCDHMTSGAAYAFAVQPGGLWEQTWHYAKGSGNEDDHFGADVSIDAGRVAIGEAAITGSVYFYQALPGGALDFTSRYFYPGTEYVVHFGARVALDGQTLLSGSTVRQQIYVLEERDGEWTEVSRIAANPIFDLDGDIFLVGVPSDDAAGENAGAVRTFVRNRRGNWRERVEFRPEDAAAGQRFGQSLAIDGDRALVGASGRSTENGKAGVAYVFERQGGGAWRQVARLDEEGGSAFPPTGGTAVALSGDMALVDSRTDYRAVAVYKRQSDGSWPLVAKLIGQNVTADSGFGGAIALDPPWVIVGASRQAHAADDEVWGAVHFFDLSPLNTVKQVTIDVKPWSASNVVDPASTRLVAVALFSSADFDALQTDLTSLRLNPGQAPSRNYRVYDADADGIPDLMAWFRIRDLQIACGRTELVLEGRTHAGQAFMGSDFVTNRRCPGP